MPGLPPSIRTVGSDNCELERQPDISQKENWGGSTKPQRLKVRQRKDQEYEEKEQEGQLGVILCGGAVTPIPPALQVLKPVIGVVQHSCLLAGLLSAQTHTHCVSILLGLLAVQIPSSWKNFHRPRPPGGVEHSPKQGVCTSCCLGKHQ